MPLGDADSELGLGALVAADVFSLMPAYPSMIL
jgi:hypothetical protein